jgi:branched-chain amino acid transport system substrate-binding protein
MRNWAVQAGVLALIGLSTTLDNAARAEEPFKVGVVVPLSGANAEFGNNIRNGMQLAADHLNVAGGIKALGGAQVELVFADVPTPNAAGTATQRLISQQSVSALVGSFVSSITLSVSEVSERAGIPLVTHSFADQITGRGYKYIFQVTPKASTFGKLQFDDALALAKEAGEAVTKVAILYEDTAYGTAQAGGLRDAAKAAGVDVVVDQGYPLGITDVSPLINKVRLSGAQIVFPVSYFNDALTIIRAMRQQKLDLPVVGGAAGYIIPAFKAGLGEFAEGVFSIAPANYDSNPALSAEYKTRYGAFMPHEAIDYGGALEVIAAAAETAKSRDPEKIRDALTTTKLCEKDFTLSIPGHCIAFDSTGLNAGTHPVFVQWRGNDLVTVYPPADAKGLAIWNGHEVK